MTVCIIQVGVDMAALAAELRKPLRPLWVSQNSLIWLDQVPDLADLEFTPLLLVSASLPNARQRRIAGELSPLLLVMIVTNSVMEGALSTPCTADELHVPTGL